MLRLAVGGDPTQRVRTARRTVTAASFPPTRPRASFKRINPDLCKAPDCQAMPYRLPALPQSTQELVKAWIDTGAKETP